MTATGDTAVRHTIVVEAPQEKAFEVFTDGLDRWWPRSHKIGPEALEQAVLEGHEGGRWYERDTDGSECDWGKVLVWARPIQLTRRMAQPPRGLRRNRLSLTARLRPIKQKPC
jgi:uncharacterized protein YndB with AHSA1/START domain